MKKSLAIFVLLFLSLGVISQNAKVLAMMDEINGQYKQDDNGNVTYVRIIDLPGLTKDQIYLLAQNYFTYNYTDAKSVIQQNDKEAGVIVGKGFYSNLTSGMDAKSWYENGTWHILRIDVKDGKARIVLSLTDYEHLFTSGAQSGTTKRIRITQQYPFTDSGEKNTYGKTFYLSHQRALATIDAVEKSLKDGTTSKSVETQSW